jgi:2-polyprenyl-3-methyl-5-hydroxy-6-metoxy-1,4-benzoquinol methylase
MVKSIGVEAHNRRAWKKLVHAGDPFTQPVSSAQVDAARQGDWQIFLSPARPAPSDWFAGLPGKDVLCLAGGGGQQGPLLAAAGARVTVFDLSPEQLAQDRLVANRNKLQINTVLGSMTDLSVFEDERFDLIVNPVSNLFVENIWPVWVESFRVLRPGGALLSGFMNPAFYIFDRQQMDDQDILQVRHSIPYSDLEALTQEELAKLTKENWPLEFGHSLEDQIGAQISVGFYIAGFYEDRDPRCTLSNYIPIYIVTRAIKPDHNC